MKSQYFFQAYRIDGGEVPGCDGVRLLDQRWSRLHMADVGLEWGRQYGHSFIQLRFGTFLSNKPVGTKVQP